MTDIRPRWEWRSFGRRFGAAEARLARLTPSGVQESDEIYLLVRRRRQCEDPRRADGHQGAAGGQCRWPRAVDARHEGRFPIQAAAEAVRVFEALALPVPTPARASYTLDEFIDAVCRAWRGQSAR
jgi:exopolyphosphatase/guanosine-5'-triphosphate,3'-diphosphate pyrophosphatase